MKKIFFGVIAVLLSGLPFTLEAGAQERSGGNHRSRTETRLTGQRAGRGNADKSAVRPGNGNSRPGQGGHNRPGNGDNYRPGHGGHNRPNHGDGYRPGHNGHRPGPGYVPAPPHRPSHSHRPGGIHRPPVMAPPTRPGRPHFGHWHRPLPPAGWRPAYRVSLVPNILGLSFGLTINTALDHLYSGGYSIDGYGSNEVYLRNVSQLGYNWDDATLYFSGGGLVRSVFYDSTVSNNRQRYVNVYRNLTNTYGVPVSNYSNAGGMSATWFGYNGDYITLEFKLMDSSTGYRYFTILSMGN